VAARETGIVGRWRAPHPSRWPWAIDPTPVEFPGVVWPAGGDDPVPVLRLYQVDMRGGAALPDVGTAVEFTLGWRAAWPCAFDVVVTES